MKKEFPRTDIKPRPHIYSKVNTWKKNYSSICSILDRSGVGFNAHDDYKIECEDEQWSQIVQKDNNARYMRNKSWPLWEEWKEIFGKDRAVGARSRGAAESAAMMHGSRPMDMDVDYHPSLDELFPDEVVANEVVGEHAIPEPGNSSNTHGERSAQKPVKIGGKKRKSIDRLECVLDIMNKMNDNTTARLDTL
ncbi:uncharacterized protein LOC121769307 [Salvia splendens]|uniref:uncharacterized protein LOC121769307 n=1 Tax=Salvia splendens TaxID=180675 RepID=UPI001C27D529|nr:uncharacterized protein LOC121769307 [Salvia splendens]